MPTPSDPARDDGLAAIVAGLDTRYRTLGEMVYEVIKEAILTGALRPGQRLRQEALAETLDVSRIPVRSALMQLEREGLVSFRAGRGAVVRSLSAGQVREIYELRELLEAHALRKVMASMTPERLARLEDLATQADRQTEGAEFVDVRTSFYRELYDAEHNPSLVKIIEELRGAVGRYLLGVRVSAQASEQHRHLVGLIAAGDADRAVAWLVHHLQSVGSSLEHLLDNPEGEEAV